MKWLLRLVRRERNRTPMPPKPYIDIHHAGKHMTDPRYNTPNELENTDPQKPHWQDPRFDSRQSTPIFDLFGFNRDWGATLQKIGLLVILVATYFELEMLLSMASSSVAEAPHGIAADAFGDREAVASEMKDAGFAVVGLRDLSNLNGLKK